MLFWLVVVFHHGRRKEELFLIGLKILAIYYCRVPGLYVRTMHAVQRMNQSVIQKRIDIDRYSRTFASKTVYYGDEYPLHTWKKQNDCMHTGATVCTPYVD